MSTESPPSRVDIIRASNAETLYFLHQENESGPTKDFPGIDEIIATIEATDLSGEQKTIQLAKLYLEGIKQQAKSISSETAATTPRTGNNWLRRTLAITAGVLVGAGGFFVGRSTAPTNASTICDAAGNVRTEVVTAVKKGGVEGGQRAAIDAYGGSYETLTAANRLYTQGGAPGLINALQGHCAFSR